LFIVAAFRWGGGTAWRDRRIRLRHGDAPASWRHGAHATDVAAEIIGRDGQKRERKRWYLYRENDVRAYFERRERDSVTWRTMRPLRYSIHVTLDGCCDHRVALATVRAHAAYEK